MKGLLQGTVELVVLCFLSFDVEKVREQLPACLRKKGKGEDKPFARGNVHADKKSKVSGVYLLQDLADAGYPLVDAFYEEPKTAGGSGKPFIKIEFVFALNPLDTVEGIQESRDELQAFAYSLLGGKQWTAVVYRNPFFQGQTLVEGRYSLVAKLDFGFEPRPNAKAKYLLVVQDDSLQIVPAGTEVGSLTFADEAWSVS